MNHPARCTLLRSFIASSSVTFALGQWQRPNAWSGCEDEARDAEPRVPDPGAGSGVGHTRGLYQTVGRSNVRHEDTDDGDLSRRINRLRASAEGGRSVQDDRTQRRSAPRICAKRGGQVVDQDCVTQSAGGAIIIPIFEGETE